MSSRRSCDALFLPNSPGQRSANSVHRSNLISWYEKINNILFLWQSKITKMSKK